MGERKAAIWDEKVVGAALGRVAAGGKEEAQDGWADPESLDQAELVSVRIVVIRSNTRSVNPATARNALNVARR